MREPRKFPSLKRALFQVHQDLERIVPTFEWGGPDDLSDLEIIIILLEDRRFFEHSGVDWRSVAREFWRMATFRKFGGASTIDMQFVRTRTGYKARTARRKFYEMILAYLLQFRMRKEEILRWYLQEMYLGSGIAGVESAANRLFRKEIYELEREECAKIAAMMVYPRPLNPSQIWTENVNRRASYGLSLYSRLGQRYKKRFE